MTTPMRGCGLAMQLDLVRLHQRVCKQLLAHLLHLRARLARVVGRHLDVHELAHTRARHGEAEMLERRLDGGALRIEDARLRPDEDCRPHASTVAGSAREASNEKPVRRSNPSTYFARVPATTSSGISGPGYVLSHPVVSQKSRTNCLSK